MDGKKKKKKRGGLLIAKPDYKRHMLLLRTRCLSHRTYIQSGYSKRRRRIRARNQNLALLRMMNLRRCIGLTGRNMGGLNQRRALVVAMMEIGVMLVQHRRSSHGAVWGLMLLGRFPFSIGMRRSLSESFLGKVLP